jgi:hypothetical protein
MFGNFRLEKDLASYFDARQQGSVGGLRNDLRTGTTGGGCYVNTGIQTRRGKDYPSTYKSCGRKKASESFGGIRGLGGYYTHYFREVGEIAISHVLLIVCLIKINVQSSHEAGFIYGYK